MNSNESVLKASAAIALIVAIPLAFIVGLAFGVGLGSSQSLSQDSISSWVSAAATVSIAILTIVLARETWILRETQMDQVKRLRLENIRPEVGLELVPSDFGMNLMLLRISNRGRGIAKSVSFKLSNRDGSPATAESNAIFESFNGLGIIKRGVSAIGISQVIETFILNFHDLRAKIGQENVLTPYLSIRVEFKDVEGNPYFNDLVFDFSEFEGITQIGGKNPLHKLADEFERFRRKFDGAVKNSGRLQMDVFSQSDRAHEIDERRRSLEEQRDNK